MRAAIPHRSRSGAKIWFGGGNEQPPPAPQTASVEVAKQQGGEEGGRSGHFMCTRPPCHTNRPSLERKLQARRGAAASAEDMECMW